MDKSVSVFLFCPLFLFCGAAAAQTAPPAQPLPTIRATASEVLLDLVVRDKRGKPVKNLKPGDVEIYEDGVRQDVKSFRFVGAREKQQQRPEIATTAQAAATTRPLRAVNLVCIVFHNLDPISRGRAIAAVQEFLQNELEPDTYIGIFSLDDRLRAVYPFTNHRNELIQAAQSAFSVAPMDFARASEVVLTANPNRLTIATTVDNATHTASTNVQLTGGEVSRASVVGADVSTGSGANALRGDQVLARSDFGAIEGMREEDKVITMIKQLGALPGRKTVLLTTTGLLTTGDPDRFQSILTRANQSGITVYALDITGMNENSTAQAANVALGQVAGVSRNQTEIVRPSGGADNTMGALGAMKQKSRQGDNTELAVRSSDSQAALRALSEGTGGFLIANTTEFRKPFQRIVDDVDAHYEAVYHPTSDKYDGHLRKIEVKLARADYHVESRTGYFAMPDIGSASTSLSFETTALAVMNTTPLPHAFDFRTAAFQFQNDGAAAQGTLVFEVPGSSLGATPRPDRKTHLVHASLLSLVKDSTGQIVDKFSLDIPYEIPDPNLAAIRATPLMYTHPVSLSPGQYTVETVVLDREGKQASTNSVPFDVAKRRKGVDLSSVMLVQRVEPISGPPDASDPLVFQGRRLVPFIAPALNADAKPFAYFVVYPDKSNAEKPKIQVEFLVGGKTLANQTADLPAPDASGAIAMVVKAATHTGDCELRITALQGSDSSTKSVKYSVSGK
jgi:VWFA-related protein